ncbi:DUF411 domain-containing protein [uncultured Jannaschia sp.]|uniref:DUF411 domain-containing protein n=1 Tax=uncultured Jannaschia sp. TaxID=293347 RepID=UPI002631DD4B|nr:DUF411 domain-containing protein [uncultured Jannaschia sp.]
MILDRRMFFRRAAAASILGAVGAPLAALAADRPLLDIARDPTCGCCSAWADLAREAGYDVRMRNADDMAAVKEAAGVPDNLRACHTARLDGYVIEGHVPFEVMSRLLAERPDIAGISVPGMPEGSPGMGSDPSARFDVIAWGGTAGGATVYHRAGTR